MELEDVLAYVERCVIEYADRHLTDIEQGIIHWTYAGLSYQDMATRMGYSQNTMRAVYGYRFWQLLKQVWPGENVTKSNFVGIVERLWQAEQNLQIDTTQKGDQKELPALDISADVLNTLDNDPTKARLFRLENTLKSGHKAVILTGAKGIGKSYLLESLDSVLDDHFTKIIYHPPDSMPTWQTWHQTLSSAGLIAFANNPDNGIPPTEYQIRQQVIATLNQNRYLLIIEQHEKLIDSPEYSAFFREMATAVEHQSCLLWVSTIQPAGIDRRITVEKLEGFSFDEAYALLKKEYPYLSDSLSQNKVHWQQLVKLCGGNPALLHKSIETLQSFHANQIQQFTAHLSSLPLSNKHLESLIGKISAVEQTLLYIFAFRPLSWPDVQAWSPVSSLEPGQLMQAWNMLHRRHLLEYFSEIDGIYQITPPYLGCYLLQKLRAIILQELNAENLKLFHTYPVSLPTASVKQQSILQNYLLIPIANTLKYQFSSEELQAKFNRLIRQLQTLPLPSQSYAAGSLFNLATHLGLSLVDVSWANLTLWHANLGVYGLQGINFQGCQFQEAVLTMGTHGSFEIALHPNRTAMAIGDSQGFLQVYQRIKNRFILVWCDELEIPIQQILITNSNTLIVILIDQRILLWDSWIHKEQSYSDIAGIATICSIDLNHDLLAIGLANREIQLWNLILGEELGDPLCDANDIVRHLAFNPDSSILAGYDNNSSVLIWHRNTSANTYTIAEAPLPLNPYGDFLAFQWVGDQLNVLETVPNDTANERLYNVVIRSFAIAGQTLAEDSINFKVKELNTNLRQPYKAAFSKNGQYLVLCDIDRSVWVWHETLPFMEFITLPELPEQFYISDDGKQLVCRNEHSVSVWDLQNQEILQAWETVSDLDQYQNCNFYTKQGFSNEELYAIQRLKGNVIE